jgi:hypothetical protein
LWQNGLTLTKYHFSDIPVQIRSRAPLFKMLYTIIPNHFANRYLLAVIAAAIVLISHSQTVARADPPPLPREEPSEKSDTAPAKPLVRVTISKETTFITEPLRDDGYPDYVRYLNEQVSQGVTPQNNAAVPLWQAMGPGDVDVEHREEFFKALGIEPLPESGPYFVTWESFYEQLPRAKRRPPANADIDPTDEIWERHERAQEEPWTSRDDPELAAWLKANEKPLHLIVEASQRAKYYNPSIEDGEPPVIFALLPHISSARLAATALSARAMLRLGEGHADQAWDDIMTIYRIARHVGSAPTLVEGLVSFAVEGIAGRAAVRVVQLGKFKSDDLAQIRQDLATLPSAAQMRKKLNLFERLCFLDAVCAVARNGVSSIRTLTDLEFAEKRRPNALNRLSSIAINWDVSLRAGNDQFDRLVAALDAPSRHERNKLLAKFDEDVSQLPAKFKEVPALFAVLFSPRKVISEKVSNVFSALMLPALTAVVQAEHRAATSFVLVELSIVLERYRLDHAGYPQKLADLSPKYIAVVPNDKFADRPMMYKRTDSGYLIYSVGKNGKDDDGLTYNDRDEADDVVIATPDATNVPKE